MIRVAAGYQQNDSAQGSPCLQGKLHLCWTLPRPAASSRQVLARRREVLVIKATCGTLPRLASWRKAREQGGAGHQNKVLSDQPDYNANSHCRLLSGTEESHLWAPQIRHFWQKCPLLGTKNGFWGLESKNREHPFTPTSSQNGIIDIRFMCLPLLDKQ